MSAGSSKWSAPNCVSTCSKARTRRRRFRGDRKLESVFSEDAFQWRDGEESAFREHRHLASKALARLLQKRPTKACDLKAGTMREHERACSKDTSDYTEIAPRSVRLQVKRIDEAERADGNKQRTEDS